MKAKILAPLLALMLSGCVIYPTGHLYPVQGALAAEAQPAIYTLTMSAVLTGGKPGWGPGNSISATLPDGEVCRGTLQALLSDDPTTRNMEADWDRIYGPGYFLANVLGIFRDRSTLVGDKGTHIVLEMYDKSPAANFLNIIGVARDDRGNLYKLTF